MKNLARIFLGKVILASVALDKIAGIDESDFSIFFLSYCFIIGKVAQAVLHLNKIQYSRKEIMVCLCAFHPPT